MMQSVNNENKRLIIAIYLVATLIVIQFSAILYLLIIHPSLTSLEIKEHYHFEYDDKVTYYSLDKEEAIDKVNNLMRVHYNLEIVESLGYTLENGIAFQISGMTSLYNRVQIIEQGSWQTMWVLTHELVHVKYQSKNETWTNFKAWVLLYESGDDVLINVAKWQLYEQLTKRQAKGYDITWYCYEYLYT